jgi:hypothetical protein
LDGKEKQGTENGGGLRSALAKDVETAHGNRFTGNVSTGLHCHELVNINQP